MKIKISYKDFRYIVMNKKNIVVIGGGNGCAVSLRSLKRHADSFNISAIISTGDSGGSSGRLREELGVLPAGDILRNILALSSKHKYSVLKSIFYEHRISGLNKLDGHNVGNLFLVLTSQYSGNFVTAMRALEQTLACIGKVYPSTLENAHLIAELENGDIVRTEAAIDRPDYNRDIKVRKVRLDNEVKIYPDAAKAIQEADYIIFGPGSLFCSIIATILPVGYKDALYESSAKFVYVSGNKYEMSGETGPTILSKFVWTLEQYLPRKIDKIIFNSNKLTELQKEHYKKNNWGTIEFDGEKLEHVVKEDFEKEVGGLDVVKLGEVFLRELI